MMKPLTILAVVVQLAVLAYMAIDREWILARGESITVRTAPIDPRDPFRGDFVRLRYAFSSARDLPLRGKLGNEPFSKGDIVYAALKAAPGGIHVVDYLGDEKPGTQPFLKGRMNSRSRRTDPARAIQWAQLRFGIEQLFVEQGAGLAIEKRRGTARSVQIPMLVNLAVSPGGVAVIRDFSWSKLGIRTERVQAPRNRQRNRQAQAEPRQQTTRSLRFKLSISNESDAAVSVLEPDHPCTLMLVPPAPRPSNTRFEPADNRCTDLVTASSTPAVIRLQPGESRTVEIDLADERWAVIRTTDGGEQQVGSIMDLARRERFRVVYRSFEVPGVNMPDDLWVGDLPSRAIRGGRLLD